MIPEQQLQGKRIVVTRARSQASTLVTALSALGAEVIELPTIEIIPLDCYEALDEAVRNAGRYQWLIVTSANTVRVVADRLAAVGLNTSAFAGLQKIAIGTATAKTMQEHGMAVDLVPESYVAESLIHAIGGRVSGSRVLLVRAAVARDVIPDQLAHRGAKIDVIDAYQTVIPTGAAQRMREVFSAPAILPDAVTFTSSSTVKNFYTLWAEAGLGPIPERLRAVSIGPITSMTLTEHGWTPEIEAETHDVQGIIKAFIDGARQVAGAKLPG